MKTVTRIVEALLGEEAFPVFPADQWKQAHTKAVQLAKQYNKEIALKKTKHFNKTVFTLAFAGKYDSDRHAYEVVKPTDPE